ncbi:efflux RND transporter periplasmic adaptor subunit, partial [Bacteroidota bacterium]
ITPSDNTVHKTEEHNGTILSYGKTRSAGFLIPVFIEIDNIDNLFPGSFIEVFLKTSTIEDAVVVPNSALMEEQTNYFVFVQKGGETYEKRYIIPGETDGVNTRILSGLRQNERIVTKGAIRIKLASMSKALPSHGHAH